MKGTAFNYENSLIFQSANNRWGIYYRSGDVYRKIPGSGNGDEAISIEDALNTSIYRAYILPSTIQESIAATTQLSEQGIQEARTQQVLEQKQQQLIKPLMI